jgi:hypothetical protein
VDNLAATCKIRFAMPILNLHDIQRDASKRMELAKRIEEIQALLDGLFPGSQVVVMTPGDDRKKAVAFDERPGIEQVIHTLVLGDGPMELQAIHAAITKRGGTMSVDTLMSILSRGGKDDVFANVSRGVWALGPAATSSARHMARLEAINRG